MDVQTKSTLKKKWWSHITVEPCFGMYLFTNAQMMFFYENLFLQKYCRYDTTHEPDLNTKCDDEKSAIAEVAFLYSWFPVATFFLINFTTMFLINWSEGAGRRKKLIILIPMIGLIGKNLMGFLHSYFWHWHPIAAALGLQFLQTLSGGQFLLHSAVQLYVSDTSSVENRTIRFFILALVQQVALPLGHMSSGLLLKSLGFSYSFIITLFFSIVAFALGVILLKELPQKVEKKKPFLDALNPLSVMKSVNILFKKRSGNKRVVLNLLLFSQSLVMFAKSVNWVEGTGRSRKLLVLIPSIGLSMKMFFGCLHTYFWNWPTIYAVITFQIAQIITGGNVLMLSAATLYIASVSSLESRTFRLGVLTFLRHLAFPMGQLCTELILKRFRLFYSFLFGFFLSILTMIFGIVLIKVEDKQIGKKESSWETLNPKKFKECLKVLVRNRPNNSRIILILMMLVRLMAVFTMAGEKSVLYLYMRHRFHWDERQYSFFDAYKNTAVICGVVLSMFVLSKWLKIHDIVIAMIAGFWDSTAAISYIFANQNWHFFVVAIFDMFHGTAFITTKSYTTKIVDPSELGQLTSLSALLIFISFLNRPTYNLLFKIYMDIFPNCIFFISAAVSILSFSFLSICYKLVKNSDNGKEIQSLEKEITYEKGKPPLYIRNNTKIII